MSSTMGASLLATSAICLTRSHIRFSLAPDEAGFAFFDFRHERFARVMGGEHRKMMGGFEFDEAAEVEFLRLDEMRLHRAQGDRRGFRNTIHDSADFLPERLIRKYFRHQSDA